MAFRSTLLSITERTSSLNKVNLFPCFASRTTLNVIFTELLFTWYKFEKESYIAEKTKTNIEFQVGQLEAVLESTKNIMKMLEEIRKEKESLLVDQKNSNAKILGLLSEEAKTVKVCYSLVRQTGFALGYVPLRHKTAKICLIAVKQNGYALEYVPEELLTTKLCSIAVKQNSMALKYVPERFKTAGICLTAVKQCGYALEYVPEKLRTEKLCLKSIPDIGGEFSLRDIPEELKTEKFCLAAVQKNFTAILLVPEKLRAQVWAARNR